MNDAEAFDQRIRRGVGRHRAYGYGMRLLRPPDTQVAGPPERCGRGTASGHHADREIVTNIVNALTEVLDGREIAENVEATIVTKIKKSPS